MTEVCQGEVFLGLCRVFHLLRVHIATNLYRNMKMCFPFLEVPIDNIIYYTFFCSRIIYLALINFVAKELCARIFLFIVAVKNIKT